MRHELIQFNKRTFIQQHINTFTGCHTPRLIIDSQAKYLRMRKNSEEKQGDKVVSPMPGKVMKIPVNEGDLLSAGDIVVVLEAMKMQSNYKVSSDCRVREILVKEGDTVNVNQVLMTLEVINQEGNAERRDI